MSELFINKKVWKEFDEDQMNKYVDDVFNHYRKHGFPYFPTDSKFREREFRLLMNYDDSDLITDCVIKQTMHGLSLAWSYMPHSWSVVCNNQKTPLDAFNDDETFRKVIIKRIKMGDNMSDNGIRKMLKMFTGVQSVSNFRPTAASSIYKKYSSVGEEVLDTSMGFGGRLLGAIKAGVNYTGCDPSTKSFEGVCNIHRDFGSSIRVNLHKVGSEDFVRPKDSVSLAFTSPPYFTTEQYSNEETQSYIKYKSKEDWMNGFMKQTVDNVRVALESKGYMIINIADVKSYKNLCDDTIKVCESSGFILVDTLKLSLSNSNFTSGKSAFKYEPVFVFKKV